MHFMITESSYSSSYQKLLQLLFQQFSRSSIVTICIISLSFSSIIMIKCVIALRSLDTNRNSSKKISDFNFNLTLILVSATPPLLALGFLTTINGSYSQFHQHFTSSFHSRRSKKCIKDNQSSHQCLFALLESAHVKAV